MKKGQTTYKLYTIKKTWNNDLNTYSGGVKEFYDGELVLTFNISLNRLTKEDALDDAKKWLEDNGLKLTEGGEE